MEQHKPKPQPIQHDYIKHGHSDHLALPLEIRLCDEEQDRLTYEQLVESLWHTLSTRIHEDAKKKKEKNNWLRKGVVEWYNDAIHITRPRIFIPL